MTLDEAIFQATSSTANVFSHVKTFYAIDRVAKHRTSLIIEGGTSVEIEMATASATLHIVLNAMDKVLE